MAGQRSQSKTKDLQHISEESDVKRSVIPEMWDMQSSIDRQHCLKTDHNISTMEGGHISLNLVSIMMKIALHKMEED